MEEEFRDVVGLEEYFQISNLGNLYSKRSNRLLKQTKLKSGYLTHATRIGGRASKCICMRIHMLVAQAFLPAPEQYQIDWASNTKYGKVYVNHIDGDKTNNKLENLEWCTGSENINHALSTGLILPQQKFPTEHGTTREYRRGCRCQECKSAYSFSRRKRYIKYGS